MSLTPRVVVVTRKSDYQLLLERHATHSQARFFLQTRGQAIEPVHEAHERLSAKIATVLGSVPKRWRRAHLDRGDLHRFLFEPRDVIVVVGQDGLVANVAKYLSGQPVIGINPDPARFDGVLVPHRAESTDGLLQATVRGAAAIEQRTMVEAAIDGGQRLVALNEIFIGHRTHQSARYELHVDGHEEAQSSSGLVVATGTGSTGWARSIHRNRRTEVVLPNPQEPRLAYFVREAFPSIATGTSLTDGALVEGQALVVVSRMNDGGVLFGDGIEDDRLGFGWGSSARLSIADRRLCLVREA